MMADGVLVFISLVSDRYNVIIPSQQASIRGCSKEDIQLLVPPNFQLPMEKRKGVKIDYDLIYNWNKYLYRINYINKHTLLKDKFYLEWKLMDGAEIDNKVSYNTYEEAVFARKESTRIFAEVARIIDSTKEFDSKEEFIRNHECFTSWTYFTEEGAKLYKKEVLANLLVVRKEVYREKE